MIAPGVSWPTGTVRPNPAGCPIAHYAYDPGVKSRVAARTKAFVRYGPTEGPRRHRHLLDVARLKLVFSSCEMLQAGLDQILRRFEVVDVRNFFATPGRLGVRYVEVLVVVHVERDPGDMIPHVCELRLEELCFNKSQEVARPHMEELYQQLQRIYDVAHKDVSAIQYLVHMVLQNLPP